MHRFPTPALVLLVLAVVITAPTSRAGVTYEPSEGPGGAKHIVLLAGDEEYRSEEALPMLGQILARHHGFRCTVLFSVDDKGVIDPKNQRSITNAAALDDADLILMSLRFRNWPDTAMKHFVDAYHRGVPIVALRTSTHAFKFDKDSSYTSYNSFGKETLGEGWVSHWGAHKKQGTRGVIEPGQEKNAILNGVSDVFGDTDVYEAHPPADVQILLRGAVTASLDPASKPIEGAKNDPMQPVAWTRLLENDAGTTNRIFCTTMGSATDFRSEDLRRLVVNAVFWGLGMESAIPARAKVDHVTPFEPSFYGFNDFKKGVKPSDHALK